MPLYDVVVVGGGPAGAAAAYYLAGGGAKVTLIDRCAFPRDKPCGDMLSESALAALARMGLSQLIAEHLPTASWSAVYSAPTGRRFFHSVPTGDLESPPYPLWATIPRYNLDAALVARAGQSGAEVFERVTVSGVHAAADRAQVWARGVQGGKIEGRLVIVATGSVGRLASGRAELFALRGYYAGESPHDLILDWESDLTPGYAWQFPVAPGLYNIGVFTTFEQTKRIDVDQRLGSASVSKGKRLLGRLKGGMVNTSFGPAAQRASENSLEARALKGASLKDAVGERFQTVSHAERMFWVGDAAGLALPHLGEGISTALRSGEIAARVALDALAQDRLSAADLSAYTSRLHEAFDDEVKQSRLLFKLMYYPALCEFLLQRGLI